MGLLEAFDTRVAHVRCSLRTMLGLDGTGTEVVFSPSGTDSQLHAIYFARLTLGGPLSSIVVGADQTGSGTSHTAQARHFASCTARGKAVLKGSALAGWPGHVAKIDIPFADTTGQVRSGENMDRIVLDAVAAEVARGRSVVLQAMSASKFGRRAPSDACLREIAARWPTKVQVVIDACQFRLGRARIAKYLEQNFLVLLTGSKFFAGPPFCGALLVPKHLSEWLASQSRLPPGLFDYADRSDLPLHWNALRSGLALQPNFGQWLRWEAALEEMSCYYALPQSYRTAVLCGLAEAIPKIIASSGCLKYWPLPANPDSGNAADDEFASPTIFPFLVRDAAGYLDTDDATEIYRSLNRDVSSQLHSGAPLGDRVLAARPCHLGQPVALTLPDIGPAAALRIAIGARSLLESWSSGPDAVGRSIEIIMADVSIAIRKIELLMNLRAQNLAVANRINASTTETSHGA